MPRFPSSPSISSSSKWSINGTERRPPSLTDTSILAYSFPSIVLDTTLALG